MPSLNYLAGYPATWLAQVEDLLSRGRLGAALQRRYPEAHAVRTDRALYAHVNGLKTRFMRHAEPLSKVAYDNQLHVVHQALGTHTAVSRVQSSQLKSKREIRIASVFKEAPAAFLNMIVVHELAHLKARQHDKAFYALCTYMEPDYHQLEWDVRLWLTAREQENPTAR